MILPRRKLWSLIAGVIAAPIIVRPGLLMPVSVVSEWQPYSWRANQWMPDGSIRSHYAYCAGSPAEGLGTVQQILAALGPNDLFDVRAVEVDRLTGKARRIDLSPAFTILG